SLLPPSFFTAPPPPEIYTLSLHYALPISALAAVARVRAGVLDPELNRWQQRLPTDSSGNELIDRRPVIDIRPCRLLRLVRAEVRDRKSTRLNSSHRTISYAVFCLKKKNKK